MNRDLMLRGQAAKNLLANHEFKFLADEVRKDIFEQFVRTNISETEKREDLFKCVNALETLIVFVQRYANDAEFELSRQEFNPGD